MALFRKTRRRRRKRPLTADEREQRVQARAKILQNVDRWAKIIDIEPGRIAVRDQRSRWGSASSLGNLNFNWRIAFMPPDIFDYVIIHELAHLREMNHSRAFWAIVEEHSPDYRAHRAWLRKLSTTTHVELA